MTERLYECFLVTQISKIVPIRATSAKEAKRKLLSSDYIFTDHAEESYGESVGAERVAAVRRDGGKWPWEKSGRKTPND